MNNPIYTPDPFFQHPHGPWHQCNEENVRRGLRQVLERFHNGELTEAQIMKGKDNGRCKKYHTNKQDVMSYWLYFQHHPGNERWKLLGQRYWSVNAYESFKRQFLHLPVNERYSKTDHGPHLKSLPKRKKAGNEGLVSEHVVPKKAIKTYLVHGNEPLETRIQYALKWNLCAVVTGEEDDRLLKDSHPDVQRENFTKFSLEAVDPWKRYKDTGITFIPNPYWTREEKEALKCYNLIATI